MDRKWLAAFLAGILLALGQMAVPPQAQAQQDPPPYCGTYPDGRPRGCSGSGEGAMEATCLAQARVDICLTYHRFNCQRGFQRACRLANLGQNCFGGDPGRCRYYQQLLTANRACNLEGNQQACFYLQQQGYQ